MAQGSAHIEFFGYRRNAVALMKSFDMLALPSWEEGIPRCLMESMAAEVSVIGWDIPGNRELVEHGVTGLLFRPERPQRVAEVILEIIDNPERAKDMTHRDRETARSRFSTTRMADDYAALYEECSRSSS